MQGAHPCRTGNGNEVDLPISNPDHASLRQKSQRQKSQQNTHRQWLQSFGWLAMTQTTSPLLAEEKTALGATASGEEKVVQ
jgi:hypothetical protein